jgi:hypothetical protein
LYGAIDERRQNPNDSSQCSPQIVDNPPIFQLMFPM